MCSEQNVTKSPTCLLQPLPIPDTHWTYIDMDFVTDLPTSLDCTVNQDVSVKQFSKMAHFVSLPGPPWSQFGKILNFLFLSLPLSLSPKKRVTFPAFLFK